MSYYESITATQMWSLYLFNKDTPKTGLELLVQTVVNPRGGANLRKPIVVA